MEENLLEAWDDFKRMVDAIDVDVTKNVLKENYSAGVRSRHGFRLLQKKAAEICKLSLKTDKTRREKK